MAARIRLPSYRTRLISSRKSAHGSARRHLRVRISESRPSTSARASFQIRSAPALKCVMRCALSTMTMPSSARSSAANSTSGVSVMAQSEVDIARPGGIGKIRQPTLAPRWCPRRFCSPLAPRQDATCLTFRQTREGNWVRTEPIRRRHPPEACRRRRAPCAARLARSRAPIIRSRGWQRQRRACSRRPDRKASR
ncbi:hypothetical protein ABIC03_004261 [Bradyrhizobium sp. RT6a]